MSPRDLFGVIVRTIGLLFIVYGFYYMVGALWPVQGVTAMEYLGPALGIFGIGMVVLATADAIVVFAYRTKETEDADEPDEKPLDSEQTLND